MTVANEPLAIGLVGCGMIGQVHADGLRKLAEDGEIVVALLGTWALVVNGTFFAAL